MARRRAAKAADAVEGPWALPEGWRWERLGTLGDWIGGGTPSKANPAFWTDGTIPWVSPKDMKTREIVETEDKITETALAGSAAKLVPSSSVLCVVRSGILVHTFPVALNRMPVALNQDMRALVPSSAAGAEFIAYFLKFSQQRILADCSKQGTTVASIETRRLQDVAIPVPPESTQQRIVSRIDALFAEIDEGEAALARAREGLETYRRSLLKAAVTGELTAAWRAAHPARESGAQLLARILADRRAAWRADPAHKGKTYKEPAAPDTAGLPELPEGWCWSSIEQLSHESPRNGLSVSESSTPTEIRALRLDALQDNEVDFSRIRYLPIDRSRAAPYELRSGDLLISRANGSPEFVGRCSPVKQAPPDTIFPDTAIRYRFGSDSALQKWVQICWRSPQSRERLLARAKTSAGILKIAQSDIAAIPLPLPPRDEIEAGIEHFEASCNVPAPLNGWDTMAKSATTLRQSILAAAFRGDLAR